MNLHVLDTDTFQLFLNEHPKVTARVGAQPATELGISVVTVEEQLSGWYTQLRQARNPERLAWAYRRLAMTVRALVKVQIVDFDEPSIHRYEAIKRLKLKVRKMDLRIAATALERDATLVTRNMKDFRQVPGLRIEDWSK